MSEAVANVIGTAETTETVKKTKMKVNDFRSYEIKILNDTGTNIFSYTGKAYIFYAERGENDFFHFIDDKNKHHRFLKNNIIVMIHEI